MRTILIAFRVTLVTMLLCGAIYPLVVYGASRLFRHQAEGSLLRDDAGKVIGSELLAQGFARAEYFQPRPSAAGASGYDAAGSGASNLGPTSKALRARVEATIARLKAENPEASMPIPLELVTTSASGLDPHLSPGAARWQAPRIAKARDVPLARIEALIDASIEDRTVGILGEPRVNVLKLNLRLDRELGRTRLPAAGAAPGG